MEQRSVSYSFEAGSEDIGWTVYLRDSSKDSDGRAEEGGDDFSSSHCSSLISDAASHVRRLLPSLNKRVMKVQKEENLAKKMTRTHEVMLEDPLEDTASSPVSNPRVVDRSRPLDVAHINSKFENAANGSGKSRSVSEVDAMKLVVENLTGTLFNVEVDDECTAGGLKEVIAAQEELPRERLMFVLEDGELCRPITHEEDKFCLVKLGFRNGSHVFLFLAPVDEEDAPEHLERDGPETNADE